MRTYVKDAWKKKIDPAFDKVVKVYVTFVEEFEKSPAEGRLNVPEDFVESLINKPDWQSLNELTYREDMLRLAKKAGLLGDKDFRNIIAFLGSTEDYNKLLKLSFKLVKSLPEEESRRFYLERLKPPPDETDKSLIDFYSIVFSLFVRYLFVKLEGDVIEGTKEDIEYFKKSHAASTLISVIYLIASQIAHQTTLARLMTGLKEGDDESLFKALTINKSLLFTEEVKSRFMKAQLTGDEKFFKKLGKALADNPLKRIGQHGKTYSVLNMFWFMGLSKLNNFELHSFLETCGLIPPAYPYAFEKFVQRHIKSVYKF